MMDCHNSPRAEGAYCPRPAPFFRPTRIIKTAGSTATPERRALVEGICAAYPDAEVVEEPRTPHNKISLHEPDLVKRLELGKRTLVLAVHKSAVRRGVEKCNGCPSYTHFSPYGFCPFDCTYCYLAGTSGVWRSPTVTLGGVCSFSMALNLTSRRLAREARDLLQLDPECKTPNDRRTRFAHTQRLEFYRYLIDTIRSVRPELEIGLCLEDGSTFRLLGMEASLGRCNCVL